MNPRTNRKEFSLLDFVERPVFWKYTHSLWESLLTHPEMPQLDRWLKSEMKKYKQFGKRDRFTYAEMIFTGVRFGYTASFLYFLSKKESDPCLEIQLCTGTVEKWIDRFEYEYPDSSAIKKSWIEMGPRLFFEKIIERYVHEYFDKETLKGHPLMNGHFKNSILFDHVKDRFENSRDMREQMIWCGIPLWFHSDLLDRKNRSGWSDEKMILFLKNHCSRPPLWIRINHEDKINQIVGELREKKFFITEYGASLELRGEKSLTATSGYEDGLFEIQDLASQKIGTLVRVQSGQLVWDCCAGGGGKTLQIASSLRQRDGTVYCSDIRRYKLEDLQKRTNRAGLSNVRILPWNGENLPVFGKEVDSRGGFDWVLIDAPCSGSGVWRRNPDAKWRIHTSDLKKWSEIQFELLTLASHAVRPSGHLVYATCSWFIKENEGIVRRFLDRAPLFQLVSQELFGNPHDDADTMFAAVLKKR